MKPVRLCNLIFGSLPRVLVIPGLILLATACTQNTLSTNSNSERSSSEQLLAAPPAGWSRIFQMNNAQTQISDFVPEGETRSDWNTQITFEANKTESLKIDPIALLEIEVTEDTRRCSFVDHHYVFSGFENGYPTAVRLFFCGKNLHNKKGEVKLVKVIEGDERIYFIRIVSRTDSFKKGNSQFGEEHIAAWSSYLREITLCDGSDNHPCP